jgi:membrane protein
VLLGAVIAAYAPSLRLRVVRRSDSAGQLFSLAISLLRELARAQDKPRRGLTVAQLSGTLRADPLQVEPLIELLLTLDWVARLDEADAKRHVLLCDPATTPAAALIDRLLLAPDEVTEAFRRRAALPMMTVADLIGG